MSRPVTRWVTGTPSSATGKPAIPERSDRKSTRLNSSHGYISYAVFCLKKKKKTNEVKQDPPPPPTATHHNQTLRASVNQTDHELLQHPASSRPEHHVRPCSAPTHSNRA